MSGNNKDPVEGLSRTVKGLIETIESQRPNPRLESDIKWFLKARDDKYIPKFYRCREYTPHDPWLFVRFLDGEGAMVGVFHHPGGLVPPGQDYMVMPGKFIAPSSELLKAIKGVIDGSTG
jgi:hypothetical protein